MTSRTAASKMNKLGRLGFAHYFLSFYVGDENIPLAKQRNQNTKTIFFYFLDLSLSFYCNFFFFFLIAIVGLLWICREECLALWLRRRHQLVMVLGLRDLVVGF